MAIADPTDIADNVLWLKADTGITSADAAGRVSGWADQSTDGTNDFAQATAANQPHIYDDPIYGKRVAFSPADTGNQWLTSSLPVNAQSFSIFVVHRIRNSVDSNVVPLFNNSTGAGNAALLMFNGLPAIYNAGDIRYSTIRMSSFLELSGFCAGASGVDVYHNHTKTSLNALAAQSTTFASLGRWNADTGCYMGDIVEVFAYSRQLTSGEQADVLEYITNKHGIQPRTTNVCLLGDSISQGVGAVEGRNLPYFLERHLGGKVRLKNYGVSGYTWANIEASVTVESIVAGQNNYVIAFAGTNDLAGGLTPAQTNSARVSALADWKTAGFDVILVHMIPRDGYSEANRDTYNGLLDASGESGIVTYDDWPQIDSGVSDYSADGIHPNSQGYAIIAQAISQSLIELSAPTATSTAEEILALFKADADFGTAGLLADAAQVLNIPRKASPIAAGAASTETRNTVSDTSSQLVETRVIS